MRDKDMPPTVVRGKMLFISGLHNHFQICRAIWAAYAVYPILPDFIISCQMLLG
jgi:hypothetical protein